MNSDVILVLLLQDAAQASAKAEGPPPGEQPLPPTRESPSPLAAESTCTVTNRVINPDARATFTVVGSCTLTLAAYELHGTGLSGQTLYDATTKEFSCSEWANATPPQPSSWASQQASGLSASSTCSGDLTVTVPDCRYQLDLAIGPPRTPPSYGQNLLAFRFGGEGTCPPMTTTTTSLSPSTTTPPTSTPTTSPPSSPTTTILTSATAIRPTASSPSAGIGTPSTPTDLATSGGEWGLLVALALGLIGAGRWVEWRGKRRRP